MPRRLSIFIAATLMVSPAWSAAVTSTCTEGSEQLPAKPKIIISDLHLGPGHIGSTALWHPLEDFRFEETFGSFLAGIASTGSVDLIIDGDFIDFWQAMPKKRVDAPSLQPGSEEESLAKLDAVLEDHAKVFEMLQRFVSQGNRLIIVPGNHDADLLWPRVQQRLRQAFEEAARPNVIITGPCYRAPGIHVEHGHQYDRANQFKHPEAPFIGDVGNRRLETNWGSTFVSRFYNDVEEQKPFIDNLQPSLSAVWWALRSEPVKNFAIPQIGKLLVMLLRDQRALDNLGYLAYTLGEGPGSEPPPKNVDGLLKLYSDADPELAAPLQELLKDPQRREEAEAALAEWKATGERAVRISQQKPTLGKVLADPYIEAARRIVIADPSVRVVIMGHTHDLDMPVKDLPKISVRAWYVNTGCWQKSASVKEVRQKRSWQSLNLDDSEIFKSRFSYVWIGYDEKGVMKPLRRFWPE